MKVTSNGSGVNAPAHPHDGRPVAPWLANLPTSPSAPLHRQANASAELARYYRLLANHDWHFEDSDDHRLWTRGRSQRQELNGLQIALDPTAAIWNLSCPASFRRQGGAA